MWSNKAGLRFGFVLYAFLFLFNVGSANAASALAAWILTSDGILKLRTASGIHLDAYFQAGYGNKGDRVWIDFPGELAKPRKLNGNGPIKEIRLGKPYKGNTRLVVEFNPSVSLNPSNLRLLGTSPNLWELRLVGLKPIGFTSIGEGNLLKPYKASNYLRTPAINSTDRFEQYDLSSLPSVQRGRFNVIIDPGHGGPDSGAVGINGLKETDVVLEISKYVSSFLGEKGIKVQLTRYREVDLGLAKRVRIANNSNADAFISIHANATRGFKREVSGIESYFFAGIYGRKLAEHIQKALLDVPGGSPDRGVRQSRFFVIRNTNMPAALIEVGFLTGRLDAKLLSQKAYRKKIAFAISKGILNYLKESY
ncbi:MULTISPECIES: N-acetylmuramoyl-L-alanine amidase [unclassified Prochlorococcus]|uniref:N-acetylmuramoyl-L-alanine amidase n=1 Tax=unclassified Prochlorococcus TaxID=2627481 RepID=UPI0005338AFC|nr:MULTISPECIES: N-acetylmuramoyl-L-alanine amidase [unclassified Prochlorococcus]KGG15368.1 N-acetylmuramoyl-L-alanine amidase [Prochlorococcus sp. MIT 0602]KGG17646.1 N-acetylmuramoyl-L-alanine amidase [Prochlorococcus sp. MIT 0603]